MLDVPRELAQYLSRLLHAERRRRGTRKNSRALTCFRQAMLGLRWFRQNAEMTALARDHGISRATGYRYLDEIIDVLAGQAPDLHEALENAKADGAAYVILDGKIFSTDRCSEKTLVAERRFSRNHVILSPRARHGRGGRLVTYSAQQAAG